MDSRESIPVTLAGEPHELELALLRERQRRVMLEFHLERVLHDLGNHMHAIELRTSFLNSLRHELGDAAELFDAVQQSAQAAKRRIESMHENAQAAKRRVESRQESAPRPVDSVSPGDALALAIALARRDCARVSVAPNVSSLPNVRGQRDWLALIFLNLLDNAREAGASVFIDGQCDDENVVLTVTDDGPGLPPETAIWKPFVSTKGDGHLGHGLPLVAQLLRICGGTIQACDRSDLRGACFTLTLRQAGTSRSTSLAAEMQQ